MSDARIPRISLRTAVAAAHPAACLPPHLPAPPRAGRLIMLAAGKAAGSMTEIAERHYLDDCGLPRRAARRPRGHAPRLWAADASRAGDRGRPSGARPGRPRCRRARARARRRRAAGRPRAGADLGRRIGELGRAGAGHRPSRTSRRSRARCCARAPTSTRSTRCASISRASRAAGSRAPRYPARVVTLAISDVPGDDPAVIGSGPTVPDPDDARRCARDRRALPARPAGP